MTTTPALDQVEAPAVRDRAEVLHPAAAHAARRRPNVGLPALALISSVGLATIVLAYALGRSGTTSAVWLFWVGLLVIVVPIGYRLYSPHASRVERACLVSLVGSHFYLVKFAYSPFVFTLPDEYVHEFNAAEIAATGALFAENPLLPVTPSYPGLETVTEALTSMTGVSTFAAGLVVVGAARLVNVLALFLLFEEVSGSVRLAGLGAFFYAAHGNFLYFSAQYKYESLALPVAIVALVGVAKWQNSRRRSDRRAWVVVAVLCISVVTVTHHVSSYAVIGYLATLSVLHALLRRPRRAAPWPFAAYSIVAAVLWLMFAAGETRGYLTSIFSNAAEAFVETVTTQDSRPLFTSASGDRAPVWERYVALGSIAIMVPAVLVGLRAIQRRYRDSPQMILLGLAATAFLGSFTLRFAPGAWELGNRMSEFLFVGTALMLAIAVIEMRSRLRWNPPAFVAFGGVVALVFMGGAIAGWPYDVRVPKPYRIVAEGAELEPQGVAVAEWARSRLGASNNIVAGDTNRRLLVVRGARYPYKSREAAVERLVREPELPSWVLDTLGDPRYVVVDRRRADFDNLRGYFFPPRRRSSDDFYPLQATTKFDELPGVQRLLDTGDIKVYDLGPQNRRSG